MTTISESYWEETRKIGEEENKKQKDDEVAMADTEKVTTPMKPPYKDGDGMRKIKAAKAEKEDEGRVAN